MTYTTRKELSFLLAVEAEAIVIELLNPAHEEALLLDMEHEKAASEAQSLAWEYEWSMMYDDDDEDFVDCLENAPFDDPLDTTDYKWW